jgi:hypothetical protein
MWRKTFSVAHGFIASCAAIITVFVQLNVLENEKLRNEYLAINSFLSF